MSPPEKVITTADEIEKLLKVRGNGGWFQKIAVTVLIGNIAAIICGVGALFVNNRLLEDVILDVKSIKLDVSRVDKELAVVKTVTAGHDSRIYRLEKTP